MIRDAIVDAVVHAPDLIRQVAIPLILLIKKNIYIYIKNIYINIYLYYMLYLEYN